MFVAHFHSRGHFVKLQTTLTFIWYTGLLKPYQIRFDTELHLSRYSGHQNSGLICLESIVIILHSQYVPGATKCFGCLLMNEVP